MDKTCENCIKADVCVFKEECMKAVQDIHNIEQRTNVFIKSDISCKKYYYKATLNNTRTR